MTRTITSHQVNPTNDLLRIEVTDQPGSGGAHHRYDIDGALFDNNPSWKADGYYTALCGKEGVTILFQQGPIHEAGINGLTHEVLLAILIDRLECFQRGGYANDYNAKALANCKDALNWLQQRTRDRMARGVEGTHQK